MVELALESYDFVKCSKWEVNQGDWTRTRAVLDHYNGQILGAMRNESEAEWLPGTLPKSEEAAPRLLLLCGGDLLETFSVPGLWKEEDVSVVSPNINFTFNFFVLVRSSPLPETMA